MARVGRSLAAQSADAAPRLASAVEFRPRIETFSTPFLYAVCAALTAGEKDYEVAFDNYLSVSLMCLVASVLALALAIGYRFTEAALFVAVLVLWSEPASSEWRVGNVNLLQLVGLAVYAGWLQVSNRRVADAGGGVTLGLLVAFKPTLAVVPLLLAGAWAIDRRWKTLVLQLASAGVGLAVSVVVGSLFLGAWSSWLNWMNALPHLAEVSTITVRMGNFSLAEWLDELMTGSGSTRAVLSTALLLLTVGVSMIALHRTRLEGADQVTGKSARLRQRDLIAVTLGSAISVLSLSLAWPHYYLLLTPLAMVVVHPLTKDHQGTKRLHVLLPSLAGLAALLAVLGRPLAILAGLEGGRGAAGPMIAGAWVLFLVAIWQLRCGHTLTSVFTTPITASGSVGERASNGAGSSSRTSSRRRSHSGTPSDRTEPNGVPMPTTLQPAATAPSR